MDVHLSRIVFFLFLGMFQIQGFGKCGSFSLRAYPSMEVIPLNSTFILEGFDRGQGIIDSLNIKYPIYLVSGDQRIALEVEGGNVGMYFLSQAILRPVSALEPNTTYVLRIDNLSAEDQGPIFKYRDHYTMIGDAKWTTSSLTDLEAPQFLTAPSYLESIYKERSCGIDQYGVFRMKVTDREETLVKVERRQMIRRDTLIHSYVLTLPESDELHIGRTMCSGEFTFKKRHTYQVRFCLLDFSGNSTGQWSDWIDFDPFVKKK